MFIFFAFVQFSRAKRNLNVIECICVLNVCEGLLFTCINTNKAENCNALTSVNIESKLCSNDFDIHSHKHRDDENNGKEKAFTAHQT